MTRTLMTEQLKQIKADIAARKAMPEYGESVEGNIERLRVIGATRSHFSTETVEMLVRALEEKSRALADAERERDDWVEHSRKMERRAIEAERKLATPIVAPDDGFDDCMEIRPDSTNDFDTGYNFGLYRYEQNIRAAGFKIEGED
ncbi:hypothetical protein ABTW52_04590 [Serratia sp. SM29]|uniref:hypothetical protein n=1 Tax=Serratia TaxID=613 RepID=UPI00289142EC|nr:hypothetical protein [Serratia marcescens]